MPRAVKRSGRCSSRSPLWLLAMHFLDLYWCVMPVLHRATECISGRPDVDHGSARSAGSSSPRSAGCRAGAPWSRCVIRAFPSRFRSKTSENIQEEDKCRVSRACSSEVAGHRAGSRCCSRQRLRRDRHGHRHLRRQGADPEAARHGRRSGLRLEAQGAGAEPDARARQERQHHGQHPRARDERPARRQDLSGAEGSGGDGPERLHLQAARVRAAAGTDLQGAELRRHASQRARAAQGERPVQHGDAGHPQGGGARLRQGRGRRSRSSATSTRG